MKRVLFIHRSVGKNLIVDGSLYAAVEGKFELSDYDHNAGVYTTNGQQRDLSISFPGGNTNPENYAELFSTSGAQRFPEFHDLLRSADVVMIKSCYPNSNIKSDAELEQIMDHYRGIASFFSAGPQLVILTSPPLVPLRTSMQAAHRAQALASWLTSTEELHGAKVFDFFTELTDTSGRLKRRYRRLLPVDSHPNATASKEIVPKLVSFLETI